MRAEYDFSKGKRGAVMPQKGKTRISIFIDNAVLDEFRARAEKGGTGYQTMMNEALRSYLSETDQLVTEKVLRQVVARLADGPFLAQAIIVSQQLLQHRVVGVQ